MFSSAKLLGHCLAENVSLAGGELLSFLNNSDSSSPNATQVLFFLEPISF